MPEPHDRPILNLKGERVAFGPIRRALLPLYERWMNDFTVIETLGVGVRPMTSESEAAWFEQAATNSTSVTYTVYELAGLRPIGTVSLRDIDHANRTATFGILIGEREEWGKGYGTETTRLMLDYAFSVLGLNNVMLTVFSQNERGLRAYRRAGFREIGRRRQARRHGRELEDVVLMDCLSAEFERPHATWNV